MNGTLKFDLNSTAGNTSVEIGERPQLCDPTVWVDKHGDSLLRYALSYVRDKQIAEDLVQDTFLAALSCHSKFAGGSSERTWLIGILKHKVIDYYRAVKRQNTVCESADASGDDPGNLKESASRSGRLGKDQAIEEWNINPGMCTQQKAFWNVLHQCLSRVSPRLASVFVLREIEQLDTKEICESLNISEGNLWVMLHRARMSLRQCLEQNWLKKIA